MEERSHCVQSDGLTPPQREVVEHVEGPLLVIAGPGSGKTRVVTRRIARLIEKGVHPSEILAITFTNKAAREMAERVAKLIPGKQVWVSTFHRFCSRLLRARPHLVGLKSNFTIFDTSDQQSLLKQIVRDLDYDPTTYTPSKIGNRISSAKNELITPEFYAERYNESVNSHLEAVVCKVFPRYQQALLAANAVDFDDLLIHVATMLSENEELRRSLDTQYRFVMVDEYQDTNKPQYQIVKALSQVEANVAATGDPDQSIYGWRGAQIENIIRFERDYPLTKVIRLEDNFRSTPQILAVADQLISNNRQRKAKSLRSNNPPGPEVELRTYDDGLHEAESIAMEIRQQVQSGRRQWSDFAIFYRVNSLSRSIETALARARVPQQIAGGVGFYERAEIKDLLCYLRLIENPEDSQAFLRVVNTPTRGIGKSSIGKLIAWGADKGCAYLEACHRADEISTLPKRAVPALKQFAYMIDDLARNMTGRVSDLLEAVLGRTSYRASLTTGAEEEDLQRNSNIDELLSAARQFDDHEPEPSLTGFLETTSLAQDVDSIEEGEGAVTLMTLHSAKGLEFPVVYLAGVEQGLLPHDRAMREGDPKQLEEERRLLFVGITRAREELYLTRCQMRLLNGRVMSTINSLFLEEISVCLKSFARSFPQIMVPGQGYRDWQHNGQRVPVTEPQFDESLESDEPSGASKARREPRTAADLNLVKEQWRKDVAQGKSPLEALKTQLKSGADLLAQAEPAPRFAVGMQVRHPIYGLGEVTELSVIANRPSVKVFFAEKAREEQFIASKCPLKPIGQQ
jgi:DNA helicase II / ATP-dependent DNA helicase PcrA